MADNDRFLLEGPIFRKFIGFVLAPKYINERGIRVPGCWKQPLVFFDGTHRLVQRAAGPCGVLAALQSHVLCQRQFDRSLSCIELLANAIIDITEKLCTGVYSVCYELDADNERAWFFSTRERRVFHNFLVASNFLFQDYALFNIALSFAYSAGPQKLSSFAIHEPLIDSGAYTSMNFVLLLITGEQIDDVCDEYRICSGSLRAGVRKQATIGLIQLHESSNGNLVPTGRNITYPLYHNWVVFDGSHFFSLVLEEGRMLIYDPFMHSEDVDCIEVTPDHYMYGKLQRVQERFGQSLFAY